MWVSSRIKTDSHILTKEAFRLLNLSSSKIRVNEVTEHDFLLSMLIHDVEKQPGNEALQTYHGHQAILTFVVALNIATVGMFYWSIDPWVHPVLLISDDVNSINHRTVSLVATSNNTFEELKTIDEIEIQNAVIIFGVLAHQQNREWQNEYSKGLLLLRMNFYDIRFRREAFLCFYRALENFATSQILNVKKLKNELRDLQKAMSKTGAPAELVDELKKIYSIRSSQVAHAQITPKEISFDDVMMVKILLDFVMHKTFKSQGEKTLGANSISKTSNQYH